jgi:hypothetical protein
MFRAKWALSLLVFFGASLAPSFAAQPSLPVSPPISTIAGNGGEGIVDGAAANAEFVYPAGLAYSQDGKTLYIADRGAQRIRILTSQGMVRTIAGSGTYLSGIGVPGGYIDGPALSAKFANPVGLAVGPDGALYIADTKNHAIRVLRHNVVSTFAGSPMRAGAADGPLATASFNDPRSLTFDHAGNLYVADYPNGIRKIDTHGMVTTTPTKEPITSVATMDSIFVGKEILLVAGAKSIRGYDLQTMQIDGQNEVHLSLEPSYIYPNMIDGYPFLGPALSVAPLDNFSYIYADPYFSTVRWMTTPPYISERALGTTPVVDGEYLRDGSKPAPSFSFPTAVLRAPDGSVTVADAGARQLRRIGKFDETSPASHEIKGELAGSKDPGKYHILLFGDSYVWPSLLPWKFSMGGRIQQRLSASPTAKNVRMYTLLRAGTWPPQMLDLIETYAKSGAADAVVFDVGWMMYVTPGDTGEADFAKKLPAFIERLKAVKKELAADNIPLYALVYLRAWDFPGEMQYRQIPKAFGDASDLTSRDPGVIMREFLLLRHELATAGVAMIDPTDALRAYRIRPNALPIFDPWDPHFTIRGEEIVGNAIGDRLLFDHPWTRKTSP